MPPTNLSPSMIASSTRMYSSRCVINAGILFIFFGIAIEKIFVFLEVYILFLQGKNFRCLKSFTGLSRC